jgi:predicted MFS family arabinose efflux permease
VLPKPKPGADLQSETPAAEAAEAILPDGPVLVAATPARLAIPSNYRTYTLVLLTLVYVINYLDRQILGILLPQIQREFTLTDTQLGLLSGTAFAVIYAVLGVPLAVVADRMNRRNVVAFSLAAFSLMTVLSGYAAQFWQLLLARFGTGIGEAGTGPSINSMLADLYPPEKRASALSFYSAGLNVGLLVGFFGGGWIAEHYGWRNAFFAAGAPGLLLAIYLLVGVREPVRGSVDNLKDEMPAPNLWTVIRGLWSQRSFRWIAIGTSMSSFGGYAGIFFIPKFLVVSHHLSLVHVSVILALLAGIPGALGTYLSGVFADRYGSREVRWNMYVPIIAAFLSAIFVPIFFLVPVTAIALVAGIVPFMMGATYVGPAFAMTQALVPLRMRARAIAVLLFVLNMIGLGLGPLAVGKLSDLLKPALGADSLRYAMTATILTGLAGAFCYWRASGPLKADIARAPSLA